jgi:hypothetical protein
MKTPIKPPAVLHLTSNRDVTLFELQGEGTHRVLHGTSYGGDEGSVARVWNGSGECLDDPRWKLDPHHPEFERALATQPPPARALRANAPWTRPPHEDDD